MTSTPATPSTPQFQPLHLGEEAKPPLAILPDPATLFADRAKRFRTLAAEHQLKSYLLFLASISDAQSALVPDLAAVALPPVEDLDRAFEFGMAPIARNVLIDEELALETLEKLLKALKSVEMPERAMASLDGVISADEAERRVMIANVLSDSLPAEEIAEHVFVAAAMQVHFARLAAALPAEKLTPVSDGACPSCGGAPVASSVIGEAGASNTRFVTCGTCATRWHVVRVKCVACSSTKGIHYQHVEGTSDTLKAECCDECKSYLKLMYQVTDPTLDPVADDVASAGLDLMVKEEGFRRAGFNVFLAGF